MRAIVETCGPVERDELEQGSNGNGEKTSAWTGGVSTSTSPD
jgi:hypothetical protein